MSRIRHVERSKSVDVLFQQAQRWYQKQDYKQALKDARILIRQDASPEHRQFLEQVVVARATELVRGNLKDQAQAVLEEILSAPVTFPAAKEQLPDLLLAVGWLERFPQFKPQNDPESHAKFLARGVDAAIVRGQPAPADLLESVELVKQAIARIEAGDEEPLAGLKEIPRSSPLADWRLFLRGFVSHAKNETEEAQSAWERLDPQRVPARMARGLMAQRKPELLKEADYHTRSFVAGLEKLVQGTSTLHVLRMAQAAVARNEWTEALNLVSRQRLMLRAADPEILQRITTIVLSKAIHAGDRDLLRDLTRCSDPLPIDPTWNRAWSLMYEQDEQLSYMEIERSWLNYVRDLGTNSALTDDERKVAQAMVLEHLAEEGLDCYAYQEDEGPDEFEEFADEFRESQEQFRAKIIGYYQQSLKLAGLKSTYKLLSDLYRDEDNQPAVIRTLKEMLQKHPDDQETLVWLSGQLSCAGQSEEALVYARDAFRRKPLDPLVKDNLWKTLRNRVRECIRAQNLPLARTILQEAEQYQPADADPFAAPALDGLLTLREGRVAEAETLFKQAEVAGGGTPPVWLMLIVDSARLHAPPATAKRFVVAWQKSFKPKFNPAVALKTAQMFFNYRTNGIEIPAETSRRVEFYDYLSRGLRAKFDEKDLQALLEMLQNDDRADQDLKQKFLNKAIKSHPENPLIVLMYVNAEIAKGPRKMAKPQTLIRMVEKAGNKIHAGTNVEDKEHLPALSAMLDTLEKLTMMSRFGFDLNEMYERFSGGFR